MNKVLVTLNYNDYKTTAEFINNLNLSDFDLVVIVDNNSSDDSFEKLQKFKSDKIHVIKSETNGGYGYGNNVGIRYANEIFDEYHLFISNPDVEFNSEVINKIDSYLSNFEVAIVSPVVKENGTLNRGWKLVSTSKAIWSNIPFFAKRLFTKMIAYDNIKYECDVTEVDAVSGCFFAIKSKVMNRIGMFDENIFLYYEENVIASKLRILGLSTIVLNNVSVNHNHSVSIDSTVSSYNKLKALKTSQYYYYSNYANANKLSLFFLKLTGLLTLFIYKKIKK